MAAEALHVVPETKPTVWRRAYKVDSNHSLHRRHERGPHDNTHGGIRQSGASIVTYSAPVLPGTMFLLGYYEDGTVVMGLPGCVMYAGATVFDLVLPRIAAGVEVTKAYLVQLGEGGLCLGCKPCH